MIYGNAQSHHAAGQLDEEVSEMVADLRNWVAREGIAKSFSKTERRLFESNLGGWSRREVIDSSWTIECLGVFLWSLNRVDQLPNYDVAFDFGLSEIITINTEKKGFAQSLREIGVIDRQRDVSELWNWRAVNSRLCIDETIDPTTSNEERLDIARRAAKVAFERGDVPEPIDGDFPAFGRAYKDVTSEELSKLTSIARERERAFNWLAGYEWNWDEVPVDT